jgi:hypothetical protein
MLRCCDELVKLSIVMNTATDAYPAEYTNSMTATLERINGRKALLLSPPSHD